MSLMQQSSRATGQSLSRQSNPFTPSCEIPPQCKRKTLARPVYEVPTFYHRHVASTRPQAVAHPATEAPLSSPATLAPPAAYFSPQTGHAKHVLQDDAGCVSLKNFTLPQLEEWCTSIGEPPKRAVHLWRWMYADRNWVRSLRDTFGLQNGVNPRFVDATQHLISTDGGLQLQGVARSKDGTRKLLFRLTGGEAQGSTIETVIIPVVRELGQKSRLTLCVSTQVGCAMNCQFCFTGRMGLLGNLTTAQIVEQVVEARRFLEAEGDTTPLTNLVYMGMGEPLHNLQAVTDSIDIVCCPLGLHVSHNKITVSTVGLVDEMRRFVPRSRAQLALSLHATTDEVRDWIVPVNRRYPLTELIAALRELFPLPPSKGTGAKARKAQLLAATAAAAARAAAIGSQGSSPPASAAVASDDAAAAAAAGWGGGEAAGGSDRMRMRVILDSPGISVGARLGSAGVRASADLNSNMGIGGARLDTSGLAPAAGGVQPWGSGGEAGVDVDVDVDVDGEGDASSSSSSAAPRALGVVDLSGSLYTSGGNTSSPSNRRIRRRMQNQTLQPGQGKEGGQQQSPPATKATLLIEYIMLRGINDTLEDAHRLARMMSGVACKINLIEFNPHEGTQFLPSLQSDVSAFKSVLIQAGHVCTVRSSRGDDEMAACGQLGGVDGGAATSKAAAKLGLRRQQPQQGEGLDGTVVEMVEGVERDELRSTRKMPAPPPLLLPPPRFQKVLQLQQEQLRQQASMAQ